MKLLKTILLGAVALPQLLSQNALAGPGGIDPTFYAYVSSQVKALAVQPDGRVLLGGSFGAVNGVSRYGLARLYSDGSLDAGFLPSGSSTVSGTVNAMALQSDGRIVIGGAFSYFNGITRYGIARLNSNGAVDGSFAPTNSSLTVNAVAVQSDNKVIIGGVNFLYRLNSDGTFDSTFINLAATFTIYAIAVQSDGKIVIGGSFTSYNGTSRNNLARLNADGTLDGLFLNGLTGANNAVRCLQMQGDGKILLGGDFSSVNNTQRNRVARLNSSGALDTGFATGPVSGGSVYALAQQSDNSILIGGNFTCSTYVSPIQYYSYNVARLYADGTMNTSFSCSNYLFNTTYALALQTDGRVVVGGNFSNFGNIARVYGNLYPPEFILQPTNKFVKVGTNVTFAATVNNPTTTYFQWRKNGSDISGATGTSFTLANVQLGDAGTYSVFASNGAGGGTSSNAVLNVGIAPVITGQPQGVTNYVGGSASFSVTATGTPLNYQWLKSGSMIAGATNSLLTFTNLSTANVGLYAVVVSNFVGSVTSSPVANLMVLTAFPPVITTQPQSQTVVAGTPVTFSVTASNATSYSWRKDGLFVSSATSYFIPSVATNQAGNYTVVVSGSGGAITSSVAVLTVLAPPSFSLQPKSSNTNVGATVTFSTVVAGTAPLSLQWRKNGVDIPYANLNTYTLGNVQFGDSGNYSVFAINAAGGVTSSNAVLNVGIMPAITAQPSSLTVTQGQSASFTVGATGAPLSYNWRKFGVNIPGATNATYTIPSTVGADAGVYQVVVSNFLGAPVSLPASLTVYVPVNITVQPASCIAGEGSNTTFMVGATGTPRNYQWFKNTIPIPGETGASYTITNVQFGDAADYTVTVSNILNMVTSQAATLTVQRFPPAITDQPVSQSIPVGGDASFVVGATGTTLNYQWQKEGTNLLGATAAALLITNVSFADMGGYSVIITNPVGCVTSIVATLTVGYAPAITLQPTNQAVPLGSNAWFSVQVSGTDPISYQWIKATNAISNETNRTLWFNSVTANDADDYSVLVTSPFGAVTSSIVTLTVQFPAQIIQPPVGGIRSVGGNIIFSVTAMGTAVNYQWQKDGVAVPGMTDTNYSLTNLTVDDSGVYTVVVSNFLGSVTSSVAGLTVGYPPVVVEAPLSSTNLLGRTVVLSCTVTGSVTMNLQWLFNTTPLADQTNSTLTLTNLQNSDAGYYALSATNAFGDTVSSSAQLSIFGTNTVVVTMSNLSQTYDGTARNVSVTVTPPGLPVAVIYNGFTTAPTNAGSYTVIGTINDPYYQGSATNTLVINPAAPMLNGATTLTGGAFQFTFTNSPGALFSVLATTNLALPLSDWIVLGGVTEVSPGQFQFTDPQATNGGQWYYRIRSP